MLSSKFMKTYFNSKSTFCGAPDPFLAIQQIEDAEVRLHALTLNTIVDISPKTTKIPKLIDAQDHWLLQSTQVAYKQSKEVEESLNQLGIGGPRQNARVWWQICRGIQGRFKGSLTSLFEENLYDADQVTTYLQASKTTFPVLSGPVVSIRWLDLISRYGEKPLKNWEGLVIPLPSSYKEIAEVLGLKTDIVHPAVVSALSLWSQSCKSSSGIDCAWKDCPRKEI